MHQMQGAVSEEKPIGDGRPSSREPHEKRVAATDAMIIPINTEYATRKEQHGHGHYFEGFGGKIDNICRRDKANSRESLNLPSQLKQAKPSVK